MERILEINALQEGNEGGFGSSLESLMIDEPEHSPGHGKSEITLFTGRRWVSNLA
jgi:hypothetical protein